MIDFSKPVCTEGELAKAIQENRMPVANVRIMCEDVVGRAPYPILGLMMHKVAYPYEEVEFYSTNGVAESLVEKNNIINIPQCKIVELYIYLYSDGTCKVSEFESLGQGTMPFPTIVSSRKIQTLMIHGEHYSKS